MRQRQCEFVREGRGDPANADSLALDAMEPVRAEVDAFLLDLLEDREFTARDFGELPNGVDPEPYRCKVKHPEAPGEYCFPPLASLITSGGHLLLALLERLVADRGGTYAMEDTDSMAIVASQRGGILGIENDRAHFDAAFDVSLSKKGRMHRGQWVFVLQRIGESWKIQEAIWTSCC
jgi:hypothetical protein